MASETILAYRISAVFHVALLVGVGICAAYSSRHVHTSSEPLTIVVEMARGVDSVEDAGTPAVITPEWNADPPTQRSLELRSAEIEIRRAQPKATPVIAARERPSEDHDECECQQPAPIVRRIASENAPPPARDAIASPPIRRVTPVSTPTTSTQAISIPGNGGQGGEPGRPDVPASLIANRPPPYPPDAYRRRQEGRVLIEARIGALGQVESLKILESSGIPSLDEAALAAVKTWRFKSAEHQGKPVASTVEVPVRFAIRGV